MNTVTVKEVAAIVRRTGEGIKAASDRVRGWTKAGFLKPVGNANPGTGHSCFYSRDSLLDALLLEFLQGWENHSIMREAKTQIQHFYSIERSWLVVSKSGAGWTVDLVKADGVARVLTSSPHHIHRIVDLKRVIS